MSQPAAPVPDSPPPAFGARSAGLPGSTVLPPTPSFGFLAFTSGSFEGAIIRDMRLANELHRRGFPVRVYWVNERQPELVDKGIPQTWLVRGFRYRLRRPSNLLDQVGRLTMLVHARRRRRFINQHPDYAAMIMGHLMQVICDGGRSDPGLVARMERAFKTDRITHVLPTFAWTCPLVQRARERPGAAFEYLPTFQGEEIFAHFAMRIGRLDDYHRVLRETMEGSPWPAVAVSHDYIDRLRQEMGLDPERLRPIYPGIELPADHDPADAGLAARDWAEIRRAFAPLREDVPLVTYLGRQDPEKGIDLLLYAVKMLAERGVKVQLACVGGSSFGHNYRKSCEAMAEHLRLDVSWKGRVTNDFRAALFRRSRCVVYPSIHREPFGMVAAEAMSYRTPVLVPNLGGITEVVDADGRRGGLTFNTWDTADLARQLERLVTDDALHAELSANARPLAETFSVANMTDWVLAHMGLPKRP